ncbi:MAG: ABC transporter ATP-binding protein [Clostridia bacterium]|nr:ABC transporter ATP-binding protein [Clostridia bacterium]
MSETILSIRGLNVKFSLRGRILHAIRGIDLDVFKGESLAIVGESGSGKSVLNKNFIGLLDQNGFVESGEIRYYGPLAQDASAPHRYVEEDGRPYVDLAQYKTEKDWLHIRGREICMIPQDPMTSLNPLKTIGSQIAEALKLHRGLRGQAAKQAAMAILEDVRIDDPKRRYSQYPHELSGGMRQRIVIAIAIACSPKILICDEPTTALDVTIQAQVLSLLKELKEKYQLTILFITHDLGVVANISERVSVMYAGDVIEIGMVDEIFFDPQHPYTWALLSSLPQLGQRGEDLFSIKGTPPNLFKEVVGDAFAPRNPSALKIDHLVQAPYFQVSPTHKAKTWLLDERAPKVEPPKSIQSLMSLGGNQNG